MTDRLAAASAPADLPGRQRRRAPASGGARRRRRRPRSARQPGLGARGRQAGPPASGGCARADRGLFRRRSGRAGVHLRRHRERRAGGRGPGPGPAAAGGGHRARCRPGRGAGCGRAAGAGRRHARPRGAGGGAEGTRRAGPGLPDARQQRDRGAASGRGRRRPVPAPWRAAACRRGAVGRTADLVAAGPRRRRRSPCPATSWAVRRGPARCCSGVRSRGSGCGRRPGGGGQERGRRGGTPSLPAIAGFAAACVEARQDLARQPALAALRDRIERRAVALGAVPCGAGAPRLANTTCLALPGRRSEAQLIALDLAGISVSSGAACSSGKVARARTCSTRWDCPRWPARRSASRYPGACGTRRSTASWTPMRRWRPASRWGGRRDLPRQPGHHPLRSARGGGDATLVHRRLRQPAQRRARHGDSAAAEAVEAARAQLAALLGVEPRELVFTSGATESQQHRDPGSRAPGADGPAIRGAASSRVATEHQVRAGDRCVTWRRTASSRWCCRSAATAGSTRSKLRSGAGGADPAGQRHGGEQRDRVDPGPARAGADRARGRRAVPHRPGAGGRARCRSTCGRCTSTSPRSAATRCMGRRGWARCIVRRRPRVRLRPLFSGGGQERGLRSGTLPTPLVVGLGEACAAGPAGAWTGRRSACARCATGCCTRLRVLIPGLQLNGDLDDRIPGNLNLRFPDTPGAGR